MYGWVPASRSTVALPEGPLVVPPPHPGPPQVVSRLPRGTQDLALTIDDGYDAQVVAAYVQFAHDSGVHLTFNPNGAYRAAWEPHAPVLRPLAEAGQVQLGNHTYTHLDLRTDAACAAAGWTRVLLWNGSFGDAAVLTPDVLMQQADRYLQPAVVMLGHANHPTITGLYGQVLELIRSRQLTPVTLDEAFGTSRASG